MEITNIQGIECFFCVLEKYFSIDYLCLHKENQLSLSHQRFEENSFDEISGTGIPEILLNIVSCYGFFQQDIPTVILTCRIKLVPYYLSKGFVVPAKFSQALNNVPDKVQTTHPCR